MKGFRLFIKQLSFIHFFIGLIALIFSFAYETWLLEIPEKFSGGYQFGKILNGIALSYIAAYIFLIIVVDWPKFKDKKKILPFVFIKVDPINGFNEKMKNRFNLEPINWKEMNYDSQIEHLTEVVKQNYWLVHKDVPLENRELSQKVKNEIVENEINEISSEIDKIKSGITYASINTRYLNADLITAIEELHSIPLFVGTTSLKSLQGMFDEENDSWDFELFVKETHSLVVTLDDIYLKFKNELEPYWKLKYQK